MALSADEQPAAAVVSARLRRVRLQQGNPVRSRTCRSTTRPGRFPRETYSLHGIASSRQATKLCARAMSDDVAIVGLTASPTRSRLRREARLGGGAGPTGVSLRLVRRDRGGGDLLRRRPFRTLRIPCRGGSQGAVRCVSGACRPAACAGCRSGRLPPCGLRRLSVGAPAALRPAPAVGRCACRSAACAGCRSVRLPLCGLRRLSVGAPAALHLHRLSVSAPAALGPAPAVGQHDRCQATSSVRIRLRFRVRR
jgi:hypothetical protein